MIMWEGEEHTLSLFIFYKIEVERANIKMTGLTHQSLIPWIVWWAPGLAGHSVLPRAAEPTNTNDEPSIVSQTTTENPALKN